MILKNAQPRLIEAMKLANQKNEKQTVTFLYNELLTSDTISSVFDWIFKRGYDFTTNRAEYRYEITIHPKL